MDRKGSDFNLVAPIYDRLASIVFGKRWKCVQRFPAADLNNRQNIMILGGGSGAILESLDAADVIYVELSGQMIVKAQERNTKSTINWINMDFLNWQTEQQFDAVYCPFFLDVFPEDELSLVIKRIKSCMTSDARLHVLDFQRGNWFQRVLTELMVLFFRIFSGLKAKRLLNIHSILEQNGFTIEKEELYYGRWIFYRVFKLSH